MSKLLFLIIIFLHENSLKFNLSTTIANIKGLS